MALSRRALRIALLASLVSAPLSLDSRLVFLTNFLSCGLSWKNVLLLCGINLFSLRLCRTVKVVLFPLHKPLTFSRWLTRSRSRSPSLMLHAEVLRWCRERLRPLDARFEPLAEMLPRFSVFLRGATTLLPATHSPTSLPAEPEAQGETRRTCPHHCRAHGAETGEFVGCGRHDTKSATDTLSTVAHDSVVSQATNGNAFKLRISRHVKREESTLLSQRPSCPS